MLAFVKVAEAGSFSAAADRLGLAKSAVSRRVAELESHLGVQLFHRTTRRLNLTDTGRGYFERCRGILEDLEEADHAVTQEHGALRGRLRVTVPLIFGLRHLAPGLIEFANLHPELEFDLDFNDRRVDLLEEGFDLAIRIGKLEDSSLIARAITRINTVVCASPAYLEAHGTPHDPHDLGTHRALVYSNLRDADTWTWWDADGVRHTRRVQVALRSNNGEFLARAAVAGRGIIHTPTFIVQDAVAQGLLTPLLTHLSWPYTQAWVVYPPTRHLSRRVRALVDFLTERCPERPPWERG